MMQDILVLDAVRSIIMISVFYVFYSWLRRTKSLVLPIES